MISTLDEAIKIIEESGYAVERQVFGSTLTKDGKSEFLFNHPIFALAEQIKKDKESLNKQDA